MYTALQFFGRGIWQVFFRISGHEIVFGYWTWIWIRFQAIWTLKMAFLGPVQSYSIWGFRSLRFKKNRF
ncbi:unnamed protein product [Rhizophagus irregularis]|nr:unnamed protein product [Rhizophagus irregularis]